MSRRLSTRTEARGGKFLLLDGAISLSPHLVPMATTGKPWSLLDRNSRTGSSDTVGTSVALRHGHDGLSRLQMSPAICHARNGGTAFPTCTYCCVRVPWKK